MECKAAIFDMDGTLLNTLEDLTDAVNVALEQNGHPKRTLELYGGSRNNRSGATHQPHKIS